MLTLKERDQVVGWMRDYPVGVPASAWGYGPMAVVDDNDKDNFPPLISFDSPTREKYG